MDTKSTRTPKTKGNRSWKKAEPLSIIKPKNHDGWRFRWVKNDAGRVEQMKLEHWVVCNKTNNMPIEMSDENVHTDLDSARQYQDMVLVALPPDWAEARDEYMDEESSKQVRGLKNNLRRDNQNAASDSKTKPADLHGTIVIE